MMYTTQGERGISCNATSPGDGTLITCARLYTGVHNLKKMLGFLKRGT